MNHDLEDCVGNVCISPSTYRMTEATVYPWQHFKVFYKQRRPETHKIIRKHESEKIYARVEFILNLVNNGDIIYIS